MADEPPPLDIEDEMPPTEGTGEEGEDLFTPVPLEEEDEQPQAPPQQEEEGGVEEVEPQQPAELAVEMATEPEQPPQEPEPDTSTAPTLEPSAADEADEDVVTKPAVQPARSLELFEDEEQEEGPEQEEEELDSYELTVAVSNPEKSGDGMGAYMTYNIVTKTTMPSFRNPETSVRRRFSDFLGLHQRLVDNHMHKGRIVPPAPEKSVVGMTMVKFAKSEEGGVTFVERRRAALERYLNRIAKHPVLRKDEDFRSFLENAGELPKAKDTAAMSGAGFMRLVKNVGESISKIAGKKADPDSWFEEQQQEYEALDIHLKKLSQAIETMIGCRKELCSSTNTFVKSIATLGNVEENDSVSRALSRLSEVEERVEALHQEQLNKDLYVFGETVKDYIALLASIKITFSLRVKTYATWQSAQATLAKKRETEQKLQTGGKPEKVALVQQEIKEWEEKVEECQKNFDQASSTLKLEVKRFETERAAEFKTKFVAYLESLMHMQQELIRLWEGYLPDAQAIAV